MELWKLKFNHFRNDNLIIQYQNYSFLSDRFGHFHMNSQTLEHPLSIAMIVLKNNFALSIQNKLSHDIFIFYTQNFRKLPSNNPAILASRCLKELLCGCQLFRSYPSEVTLDRESQQEIKHRSCCAPKT